MRKKTVLETLSVLEDVAVFNREKYDQREGQPLRNAIEQNLFWYYDGRADAFKFVQKMIVSGKFEAYKDSLKEVIPK